MKDVAIDNQRMNKRNKEIDSFLAENERILDKINKRLDNINAKQKEIEKMKEAFDEIVVEWKEWTESKKGVG